MNLNLVEKKSNAEAKIIIVKNKKIKSDKEVLKALNFKGEDESCVVLPELKKIYVGCPDVTSDNIRVAAAIGIKKLNTTNFKTASIEAGENLREIVEGIKLGNYTFTKYKKEDKKKKEKNYRYCCR